ncbi:MAG: amidohydrolase [Ignavibacteriales bacterium CG_4_9_14_3_um_filter_34_10]|nr:MAG: amidohydrolase [Ignavibacteriales bacterium CG_4_9_14_3_um_filter_34_10]
MRKNKKAFINGNIFTVNERMKWAESIITSCGKIIFVGTNSQAQNFIDDDTEIIDLNGKLVLPGFIDSHAHLILGGFYLQGIDLSTAKSKTKFQNIFSDFIKNHKSGWIKGGNWNHQLFDKVELPTKEWIDEITKGIPVFVHRMDYHMALANSVALKQANITAETSNPVGGTIEKDESGEPTGILKDKAMDLIYKILPTPTTDEYQNAIQLAMNEAEKFGITSVHDISYKNHFAELQKFEREKKLTCRIYSILPIELHKNIIKSEIICPFGNDKLKIGAMKAFADGSLGSSTAYFSEPYEDDKSNYGLAMEILSSGKLSDWAFECDKHSLQLVIHAIGDRAISEVIDIYESINKVHGNRDRRMRIEHAQHMNKNDFQRLYNNNIIISAQPYHLYDDGPWAINKIGNERLRTTYAFNSFLKNNIRLCFGSDWPVSTFNPIEGIYAAVIRQTSDGLNKNGLISEEKISVEDAVKCYTINAAFASFSEELVGSIETGKFADFIVLDENIFTISSEAIRDVKVEMTIFNGEIIYSLKK